MELLLSFCFYILNPAKKKQIKINRSKKDFLQSQGGSCGQRMLQEYVLSYALLRFLGYIPTFEAKLIARYEQPVLAFLSKSKRANWVIGACP